MTKQPSWNSFQASFFHHPETDFSFDWSRMAFGLDFIRKFNPQVTKALAEMEDLEKGSIANLDEKRMVGHYWLRDAELAPSAELKEVIKGAFQRIVDFAKDIHTGKIKSPSGEPFKSVVLAGIGGSALGPQLVHDALGSAADKMQIFFMDNTDPDGFVRTLSKIPSLKQTLAIVVSKSGGTKETKHCQIFLEEEFKKITDKPSAHFVAVTSEGSDLDKYAVQSDWLARFPMWDWIGGRTSVMSAVGLLPAALQGCDIEKFISGGKIMDQMTRNPDVLKNPALIMALSWYHAGCGKGMRDMVVLPYKDRLLLFSRYLQQLVMESLGKEHSRSGEVVEQGLVVYGNKGSTDQHAFVQQLRDGPNNFFCTFIRVLSDKVAGVGIKEASRDYLNGFLLGTRKALFEKGKESLTITIPEVNAFTLGQLLALFERAVGFYASFINVNAYHQPGVEAGKKAAEDVIKVQAEILRLLKEEKIDLGVEEIAKKLKMVGDEETIFQILRYLSVNHRVTTRESPTLFQDRYQYKQ